MRSQGEFPSLYWLYWFKWAALAFGCFLSGVALRAQANHVPPGEASISVTHTGYHPVKETFTVVPGQPAVREINLTSSAARKADVIKLQIQGVKPAPPTPAPEPVATATPRVDIKLTGITSVQDRKTAFFMTAAAGERARYHTLSEGEKDDRLEVLSIDLAGDTVEALVEQVYHRLSFATHGFQGVLSSGEPKTPLEEIRFNEEHIRRHAENERRELIRIRQERAEAEVERERRAEAKKKSGAEPRGEDTHAAGP